jgi:hypothetical protein
LPALVFIFQMFEFAPTLRHLNAAAWLPAEQPIERRAGWRTYLLNLPGVRPYYRSDDESND